jgi:hypothetical protein
MSVSGEVATARIASAASHSDRDCGTRASASYEKKDLAEEQRRRAEREDREASVASSSSPGWAMASSSPTAIAISASTINGSSRWR